LLALESSYDYVLWNHQEIMRPSKHQSAVSNLQTIEEFAKETKASVNTIRTWISKGIIPHIRVGYVIRIEKTEALEALREYTQRTSPTIGAAVNV
jgi:excisionase family DNA binding protein